jgi:protein TonB
MIDTRLSLAFVTALFVHLAVLALPLHTQLPEVTLPDAAAVTIRVGEIFQGPEQAVADQKPEPVAEAVPEPDPTPVVETLTMVKEQVTTAAVASLEDERAVVDPIEKREPKVVETVPGIVKIEATRHKKLTPVTRPVQSEKNDSTAESSQPLTTPANPAPEQKSGEGPSAAPASSESASSEAAALSEAVPLYQDNPKPVYPPLARKRGWQGTVLLEVLVSTDGDAVSCVVQHSSGYEVLDRAALRAVWRWKFSPGRVHGVAQAMPVTVPVTFNLK